MVFNCYGIAPIDIFIYSHGDLVSVLVIIQDSPYEYAQGNPGVLYKHQMCCSRLRGTDISGKYSSCQEDSAVSRTVPRTTNFNVV